MKTKIMLENDYFKSPDLPLCAALCWYGYKIEAIDKQNPAKAFFLLKRDSKMDERIQEFWLHGLKVDALGYFNCLKELKSRIYN